MSTVVMLAGRTAAHESLARIVGRLREAGSVVVLAGMTDVEKTHLDVGADVLRSIRRNVDADPEFYRAARTASPSVETWRYVERDTSLVETCRTADVIVALDMRAVYAVWELGKIAPRADLRHGALPGYDAAMERSGDRSDNGASSVAAPQDRPSVRQLTRRAARTVLASRIVLTRPAREMWTRLLASEHVSASRRVRLGVDVVVRLHLAGRSEEATRLSDAVLAGLDRARDRANLRGGVVARLVDAGIAPLELREAVTEELSYTDELLRRGEIDRAVGSLLQALRLAYDQAIHFSSTTSPLADDPEGFTAPLRASVAIGQIARARGRVAQASPPPSDRPARVLVATHGNTSFVEQLQSHLVEHRRAQVRSVDLTGIGRAKLLAGEPRRMYASLLKDDFSAEKIAEAGLREHLDWADVVFIDWCTSLVRVFNLVDPGSTRIVVRLHSYEAFTQWPHLIDVSRIDTFVFVSDHVKDLVVAQVPALLGADAPQLRVVPNALSLERFVRPKPDDARFTIGLIGYQFVAKDPRWALEVVRRVREHDSRYRLRLIGHPFDGRFGAAAAAYGDAFERELAALEMEGAVERYGYTSDLPSAVEEVGVILTSSVREGSPVALLEAAASGCVPVVRDWPFFARLEHGPRTMYPTEWVVDTPQQAADRILTVSRDVQRWRAASAAASDYVRSRWDLSVTGDEYERLLFG